MAWLDLDAEFQQFPMNAGRAPQRVGLPHAADRIRDFCADLWAGRAIKCPKAFLARKATAGEYSSIDLPEHDVERADDRRDVGKHVPAA
jgi:hypothetical protein